ncbi:MAG: hypothetical protein AB1630_08290 [bacterium]
MKKINVELDDLRNKAEEELEKEDIASLLENLRQKILECYEIERKAFQVSSIKY